MTSLLLVAVLSAGVVAVRAAVWWLISSPVRLGAASAVGALAHAAPAPAIVAVLSLLLAALAAAILVRSLRATGGRLMTTTKPLVQVIPR